MWRDRVCVQRRVSSSEIRIRTRGPWCLPVWLPEKTGEGLALPVVTVRETAVRLLGTLVALKRRRAAR